MVDDAARPRGCERIVTVGVKAMGRQVALAVSDQWGRRTAARRVLPDLLIVGGQRCGTTTLFKSLQRHRAFLGPTLRKGVHYFDLEPDRSIDWYRAHFPTQEGVDRRRQTLGGRVVVGESSPYYLWHPLAADRIAAALPDVQVIALLRDPVERAYSAHAHELARGFETEPFERALELEESRLRGESELLRSRKRARSFPHQHLAYIQRGEYIDQLERMEHAVGRDQMLVLDSADFWAAPEESWPLVTSFLSLPDLQVVLKRHNARPRAPMSEALRTRLSDHFLPYDQRLAKWWGRDPSWRR